MSTQQKRFEEFVYRTRANDPYYLAFDHENGVVYTNTDLFTARTIKGGVGIGTRCYIPLEEMRKLYPEASENLDRLKEQVLALVEEEEQKCETR